MQPMDVLEIFRKQMDGIGLTCAAGLPREVSRSAR